MGLFLLLLCLSSCSDDKDDSPYPSIVTQMADCPTDEQGTLATLVLDDDTQLPIVNRQEGLKPNVVYRCLADFTIEDGKALLYGLKGCPVLYDSTSVARTDPVNVASLWRTRRYLNLHLLPKTQNQTGHGWGFITDSIAGRHAYLRLHHRQGSDPTAYTTDVFASLPLELVEADTVTLRIATFDGLRDWTLP